MVFTIPTCSIVCLEFQVGQKGQQKQGYDLNSCTVSWIESKLFSKLLGGKCVEQLFKVKWQGAFLNKSPQLKYVCKLDQGHKM